MTWIPRMIPVGAVPLAGGRCRFRVWAPNARSMEVHLLEERDRLVPMRTEERGYHEAVVTGAGPGTRYRYRIGGQAELPDPASRFQPDGVHGPSQVVDAAFEWTDQAWRGLPLDAYVFYEVHVGMYTREGTFDAIVPHLEALAALGVTALEIMPVAQFPGDRNWGYDGAFPFAVQNSYGGPDGLRRLVDACHARGLAVVLDVVYNHLGPEGNYLGAFGHYFAPRYRTPWGDAVNFDGEHSDEVRSFFLQNALHWVRDFHVDALRVDAIHGIFDFSATRFLEQLQLAVHEEATREGRHVHVIAESDLNDPGVVRAPSRGGLGFDAQWDDDFHHALHALLTGERQGYYQDFGRVEHLARALTRGFVYDGRYSSFRRRSHGAEGGDIEPRRLVVFAQNHDQVGNRMGGERLAALVSFEALKVAAAAVLLSPYLPLLFMGEEYGETAPFLYFVSHSDAALVEAVREGRLREFEAFATGTEPPDPQDPSTFAACKLDPRRGDRARGRTLREFYAELLRIRTSLPAFASRGREDIEALAFEAPPVLWMRRWSGASEAAAIFAFSDGEASPSVRVPAGEWDKRLDSADERWGGQGSRVPQRLHGPGEARVALPGHACVVFERVR